MKPSYLWISFPGGRMSIYGISVTSSTQSGKIIQIMETMRTVGVIRHPHCRLLR